MKYPEFLKREDVIGIFAPSAGVGHKIERYEASLNVLKNETYRIRETASVRNEGDRSAGALQRAKELKELVSDDEVKAVLCAAGGDFMYEMMPKVDFSLLVSHPKWIIGASDPTNLLFPLTVKYDIATMYGFNAGYNGKGERYEKTFLSYLKGDLKSQKSYSRYKTFIEMINDEKKYTHEVKWKGSKGDLVMEGRIIGGCFDVLATLIGTPFDGVNDFIERYKEDGILWYFDNFASNSLQTYLTLLQMKNAGWFRHCKGVLIGRTAFESESSITYAEVYRRAFGKIPYIYEADLGHTDPHFTIINGAVAKVKKKGEKGEISFILR